MAKYMSGSGVKLSILLLGLGMLAYLVGPPFYWRFVGGRGGLLAHCPVCANECPIEDEVIVALQECLQIDSDMAQELKRAKYQTLREELSEQQIVTEEAERKSSAAILEAKRTASQYQKENEKCNLGMETSEKAREKSEQLLADMTNNAALWEQRAKSLGWAEDTESVATTVRETETDDVGQLDAEATSLKERETEEVGQLDLEATTVKETETEEMGQLDGEATTLKERETEEVGQLDSEATTVKETETEETGQLDSEAITVKATEAEEVGQLDSTEEEKIQMK